MKNNQMELGIDAKPALCRNRRRQRRLPGARWWFDQMHRAVEQAGSEADKLRQIKQDAFAFPNGRN